MHTHLATRGGELANVLPQVRFDLADFSTSTVTQLDLTEVNSGLKGFRRAPLHSRSHRTMKPSPAASSDCMLPS